MTIAAHQQGSSPTITQINGLTGAQTAILRFISTYHYVTAAQVCCGLYSPGSMTWVYTKLKELADHKLLQVVFLPRPARNGSAPHVYTLTRSGQRYLAQCGYPLPARARPERSATYSFLHLHHALAVTDFLIAAHRLSQQVTGLELQKAQHDLDLKHNPIPVDVNDGKMTKRIHVIPDAWLDFRATQEQICIALELDRGTQHQPRWLAKVRALVAWSKGPYQQAFGTDVLTIAVLTTAGTKRLEDLLTWTTRYLDTMGEDPSLFCFAAAQPAERTPGDLFLTPFWVTPDQNRTRVTLLEGVSHA